MTSMDRMMLSWNIPDVGLHLSLYIYIANPCSLSIYHNIDTNTVSVAARLSQSSGTGYRCFLFPGKCCSRR